MYLSSRYRFIYWIWKYLNKMKNSKTFNNLFEVQIFSFELIELKISTVFDAFKSLYSEFGKMLVVGNFI